MPETLNKQEVFARLVKKFTPEEAMEILGTVFPPQVQAQSDDPDDGSGPKGGGGHTP